MVVAGCFYLCALAVIVGMFSEAIRTRAGGTANVAGKAFSVAFVVLVLSGAVLAVGALS